MTTERLATRKDMTLYFAAAAAIAVAGALHLMMAPGIFRFNVGQGILFTVGGIAQVFWIIPMIRKWGRAWYSIGIAGNFAFFAIWLITRFPGNPITGRGELRINSTEMIIEGAQLAFIGLVEAILVFGKAAGPSRKEKPRPLQEEKRSKRGLMILAGI